jgi:hypothetical protein
MFTQRTDIRVALFPHQEGQPEYDVVCFNAILHALQQLINTGMFPLVCEHGEHEAVCEDCLFTLAYDLYMKARPHAVVRVA